MPAAPTSFLIQFVGLICMFGQDANTRVALLPNALNEPHQHVARIAVDKNSILDKTNWAAAEVVAIDKDPLCTSFLLTEPATVEIADAGVPIPNQPLKFDKHPVAVPAGFKIDPILKNAIAQVPIRRGVLTAKLYPGSSQANVDASVITEATVPHTGPIVIKVTPKSGGTPKTITLKAGTEIAVVNDVPKKVKDKMAADGVKFEHYGVYQRLGTQDSPSVGATPQRPPGLTVSHSAHRLFNGVGGVVDGVKCPNNTCCP